MKKQLLFLLVFMGCGMTSSRLEAQTFSATDGVIVNTSGFTSDFGRGFDFVPTVNIAVTSLGKRVPQGTQYAWKIWEVNTQTLVYSQTSLSTTPNIYTYEPVSAPFTLQAGVRYSIILYGGGDARYYYGPSSQVNSLLTYSGVMRYCNTCSATQPFPTLTLSNYHYGTPDFLFVTTATHLNFDGVDDNVNLGTSLNAVLDPLNTITVEAWVKPEINTGLGTIIGNYTNGSGGMQFLLRRDNDAYTFWVNDGTGFKVATTLANSVVVNTWQHVAGVWDGSNLKIYLDGALQATTTGVTGTSFVTIANNTIIGLNGMNENFKGSIDEVRVWSTALNTNDITRRRNCELQGTETGLLAYYKFNQGDHAGNNTAITSLMDAVTPPNNGTLNGFALTGTTSNFLAGSPVTTGSVIPTTPTVTTPITYTQGASATPLTATSGGTGLLWYTTATGGTGSATAPTPSTTAAGTTSYWVSSTNTAGCESTRKQIDVVVNAPATHLNFDGVNDRVDITLPAVFNNITTNAFSVETWIKPSVLNFSRIFFAQKDMNNFFAITLAIDGTIYAYLNNTTSAKTNAPVSTTAWTQVTVTKEAVTNAILIYFNGVLQATGGGGTSTTGTDNLLTLGSRTNQAQFYNGNLDEVRVWNRVLPVAEILNNTNCELPTPTTQTGLVAYYQFNQGLDAMNNTGITSLTDSSVTANNGTLFNFGLTGTTSNWLSGSPIVTGTTCGALGTTSFELASKLSIFPNPATNNVTIQFQDLDNANLEVSDINGRVLFAQKLNNTSNTVNIENLTSGIYLFKVSSSQGTATSKVVKN